MLSIEIGGTQYPTRDVAGAPWVRYDVCTTHGSDLSIYFQHNLDILSPSKTDTVVLRGGLVRVIGHSVLQSAQIDLPGLGFQPVVGGHVAVGTDGKLENGMDRIKEELIKTIYNTEEVGISPPE
jgi:hypothetical protein